MTLRDTLPATLPAGLPELGEHPTTDQIDERVRSLIEAHFQGEIDEVATRREITSMLYVSGIPNEEAQRAKAPLTPQQRFDLGEALLHLLTDKMLSGNFFSLETGRTSSLCGWARQVAKAAVASEIRNARRATNRNGDPWDPQNHSFERAAGSGQRLVVNDAYSTHVDGAVTTLVEEFTERTRGMRDTDRVVASAETLCFALGIEPALRPERMEDRDACLAALTTDENLAHRSLKAWNALVHGSDASAVGDVDDRLLALWDEQTEDSTTELLTRPAHVAHMLALAAVSPLPRPNKKALQKFKTVVMAGNGIRDKRWRELASSLVDAYVASEYEAVSQYATMSAEARSAAIIGHTIDRNRLETLLERAANHPGAPFGPAPARVLARLSEVADVVLNEQPADQKTTPKVAAKAAPKAA